MRAGALDIVVSPEGDTVRVTEGDAVLSLFRFMEAGYFQRLRSVISALIGSSRGSGTSITVKRGVRWLPIKQPNHGE